MPRPGAALSGSPPGGASLVVECVIDLARDTSGPLRLPDFPDVHLVVSLRPVRDHGLLPPGAVGVVFLVNQRSPAPDATRDAAYLFQPQLVLHGQTPFVPRPDLHGLGSRDRDESVADLQYRDVVEYSVGHNVSAMALPIPTEAVDRSEARGCPSRRSRKVIAADFLE